MTTLDKLNERITKLEGNLARGAGILSSRTEREWREQLRFLYDVKKDLTQ